MRPRWAALPGNLRGAVLMCGAACMFAVEALFVRWMTQRGIPVATQVLARATGQLLWVLPAVAMAGGLAVFRTRRLPLHLLRGLASLLTWGLYFLSFGYLDLATATVLSFTNVVFTSLLAGPLLGERVDAVRWGGALAGLLGVAVMLRPGAEVSLLGAGISLAAALAWCGITLTSRVLTRTETTISVVGWVGVVTFAGIAPVAALTWRPIGLVDLLTLLAFGITTPGILWLMTEAYRAGEASAVSPLQYLRLPVVAGFGWLLFGEVPDAVAWLGASVILAGAVAVTIGEARRAR